MSAMIHVIPLPITGRATMARRLKPSVNHCSRSRSLSAQNRTNIGPVVGNRRFVYRKYPRDPEYPPHLYHPSFSIGFTIDSFHATGLNDLRAKYGFRSGGYKVGQPWTSMRGFFGFPVSHLEFCQEVLRKVASKTLECAINIDEPFRSAIKASGNCALGFNLSSPELHAIHAELVRNFKHILAEMRSKSTPMTRGAPHHSIIRQRNEQWLGVGKSHRFYPRALVTKALEGKAEEILQDMKEQRSSGTWTATLVSLRTSWMPRQEYWRSADYVDKFIEFPLQKRVA